MVWQAAGGRCRREHTRACSHPGQPGRKTHGTMVAGEVQLDARTGKTDEVETGSWTGPERSNQRKRRIHREVEVGCHTPARRRWHRDQASESCGFQAGPGRGSLTSRQDSAGSAGQTSADDETARPYR